MGVNRYCLCAGLLFIGIIIHAQTYNLVIKHGHIIDPKNSVHEVMDIAIRDGIIVRVAKNIDSVQSLQTVYADGLYVTPGLIDIHSHNFHGMRIGDPFPDGFTFRNGVTTTVDAGSSGWKSFPAFKEEIIDKSETRVLAWLNIVGEGFRGGAYEQNTADMDSKLTSIIARRYKDYIIGIKVAHFNGPEWIPVDRAVEAGNRAGNIPVMVDFGSSTPALSLEELFLKHLRVGDIYTHCFGGYIDDEGNGREPIVDENSNVKAFVSAAQKRGIIFDVGFGAASFTFSHAISAIKTGFYPNSISTDLNRHSFNNAMQDILNVMSLFMAIGMDLPSVIKATTWNPAQQIKREELGHLSVGSSADLAIFNLREGKFGFYDKDGYKIEGTKRLECEMTILGGRIVYDHNGIASPITIPSHNLY